MNFASDNTGPAHPRIIDALVAANTGAAAPYGNDPLSADVADQIRTLFEAPEAAVALVATGSAANALALACFAQPYDGIFCHRIAHVEEDECGAPEFYTGGAKLLLVDGADGKMDPDALRAAIAQAAGRGVHGVQPGPVTLTNITEAGSAYSLDEIAEITAIARAHGLPTHLDGARFANACAALGVTPAEMTWKSGIDAVSFGGTKNGCLGVEAVVIFDPSHARALELRRKRGGHLFSKHRFLAAQMQGYLAGDLWRDMARSANAAMAHLLAVLPKVPGARLDHPAPGNLAFITLPRAAHQRAFAAGHTYYLSHGAHADEGPADEALRCRIVMDWSKTHAEVDALIAAWHGA